MAEPTAGDPFIIISGHDPQAGKRERLSKARAHITKRYFHKLHKGAKAELHRHHTSLNRIGQSENVGEIAIVKELRNSVPVTSHPLLDPVFFAAETTQRMHKFFDVHLRGSVDDLPLLNNIVRWSISNPYFMSAKLLNASGWDDILEWGELSPWTTRQRFITLHLLNDTFANDVGARNNHITVGALQSLLAFELLMNSNENISRLQLFYQGFMSQLDQPNDDEWTLVIRSNHLLSCVDCLRRAGNNDHLADASMADPHFYEQEARTHSYFKYQFALPLHSSLFTFGQPCLAEDNHPIYALLSELYDTLSISVRRQSLPTSRSIYNRLVSRHEELLPHISYQDHPKTNHLISNPAATIPDTIAPLRLSIFILLSCLLSANEKHQTQSSVKLASQLRIMLSSRNHTNWEPFQGALIWCLAIGLRFADARPDRTWFMMQFLRVTHRCVLSTWDEASRSLEVVVYGLERVGRVGMPSSNDVFGV